MPALPPAVAPAAYIPFTALACASEGASVAVGPGNPLPVIATPGAAASAPLTGTTAASGTLGPFTPDPARPIHLTLSGTWSGNVRVKRSTDGGATRHPLTVGGIAWGAFTGNCCELVAEESEAGAQYYLDVTLASGTLAYRVSQ